MATPALRRLRDALPGAFIGGMVRPGIDQVLAGTRFFDEVHVEHARGVMGHKHAASRLRQRRYDAALLLTNSFSTALTARLAGIGRRVGYARDGRSLLLTDRLEAPKRADGRWAPVPAVRYYWDAAGALLSQPVAPDRFSLPAGVTLELAAPPEARAAADELLTRAGVAPGGPLAILNPGGNNDAKRWPPERFAAVADHLASRDLTVLVSGAPAEADLADAIAAAARRPTLSLPRAGVTLSALKGVLASPRARLMVTNDTGPRHIAAAFGVPVVTLFGPTDHRWTTIPAPGGEEIILADPTLPESEIADDHPDRCRVDRIDGATVLAACERLLSGPAS
jgi:heptosyltransferase-2